MNDPIDLLVLAFVACFAIAVVGLILSTIGWAVERVMRERQRQHLIELTRKPWNEWTQDEWREAIERFYEESGR